MLDSTQRMELLQEDSPAKISAWLEKGLAWLAKEAGYSGKLEDLWKKRKQSGSSLKTSLVYYPLTEGRTLESFSGRWPTSGIVSGGECLMLSTLEYPSEGAESSSLADVVETQQVQQKYYLTAKAAEGVLRRSNRNGKKLPEQLQEAFENVVRQESQGATQ